MHLKIKLGKKNNIRTWREEQFIWSLLTPNNPQKRKEPIKEAIAPAPKYGAWLL